MIKLIEKLLGISKLKAENEKLRKENAKLVDLVELKTFEAERWMTLRYSACDAIDKTKEEIWLLPDWYKLSKKEFYDFIHKTAGKNLWECGDKAIYELKKKYGDDYETLNELFINDFGPIMCDNIRKEFKERMGESL